MRRLAILALLLLTTAPVSAAVCLSKSQARQLWPTKHIYWYYESGRRCWSDRHGPPKGLQIDPLMNKTSQAEQVLAQESGHKKSPRRQADEERTYRSDEFNPLDAQADRNTYFGGEPIETWASVTHHNLYRQFTPWDERIDGALR